MAVKRNGRVVARGVLVTLSFMTYRLPISARELIARQRSSFQRKELVPASGKTFSLGPLTNTVKS
jgi:hypothetical protein